VILSNKKGKRAFQISGSIQGAGPGRGKSPLGVLKTPEEGRVRPWRPAKGKVDVRHVVNKKNSHAADSTRGPTGVGGEGFATPYFSDKKENKVSKRYTR